MPEKLLQPTTWQRSEDKVALLPSYCSHCDAYYFPPITGCVECFKQDLEQVPISETGVLYSYTTIWVPRKGYPNPYTVAYVDFPRINMRVFGRLTSNGSFELDSEVELTHGVLRVEEAELKDVQSDGTKPETGDSVVSYMFRLIGG